MFSLHGFQALNYPKEILKADIQNIPLKHSCDIYDYLSTSSLCPQTICVSSVRVPDAVQRMNYLKQHIDITSGKYTMWTVQMFF